MSGKFINDPSVLLPSTRKRAVVPKDQVAATSKATSVFFWYFDDVPSTECTLPTYSQSMPRVHEGLPGAESIVNAVDGRVKVNAEDYENVDGKYRVTPRRSEL